MNETEKNLLKKSVLKTVNDLFNNEEIYVNIINKPNVIRYGANCNVTLRGKILIIETGTHELEVNSNTFVREI